MTANEIKTTARNLTVTALTEVLNANDAVQFADASFAKISPAFDPYEAAEEWKTEKELKAKEKAEKDAEKERKAKERESKKKEKEEEGE